MELAGLETRWTHKEPTAHIEGALKLFYLIVE